MHLIRNIKFLMICGLSISSIAFSAMAADVTLIISSWAPPSHGMNATMFPKLIKMMEEATEGRVTAKIKYKLGSPPAQFDLIQDGVADITWIFHGYNPGRYVATKIIELPGYSGSAKAASIAYWKAQEKYFAAANEHKGVKLIGLMTHGPGQLHSARKVTRLDQINGMKLRLGGGVSGDVGDALGATGIRVPAPKVYETLASKAADGVMMPMEGKKSFKLTEVAQHTYIMPGGFYRGSFAVIMNQEKFDSLSAKDQKALNGVFGLPLSSMAGQVWDSIDGAGFSTTSSASDNSINQASSLDQAEFAKMSKKIVSKVLKEVSAKGVDGKAAQAFIAAEMAKL